MTRRLALLLTLLVGLGPLDADAKPRDAVVAEAQVQPGADLNEILEANGWTVLGLPSNMHLPGKLFKPGASSAQGTCVDATPVTGDLPSIEAQGSKGFVVEVVVVNVVTKSSKTIGTLGSPWVQWGTDTGFGLLHCSASPTLSSAHPS